MPTKKKAMIPIQKVLSCDALYQMLLGSSSSKDDIANNEYHDHTQYSVKSFTIDIHGKRSANYRPYNSRERQIDAIGKCCDSFRLKPFDSKDILNDNGDPVGAIGNCGWES